MKQTLTLLITLLLVPLAALNAADAPAKPAGGKPEVSPSRIKAYCTRLPFDDHGFTGKYADSRVFLQMNGQTKAHGVDYRAGIEVDTDGNYALVIWLPLSATQAVSFVVGEKKDTTD